MDELPPRQRSHSPLANGQMEQQHSHSHSHSHSRSPGGGMHLDSSDNERPLSSNQLTATPHSASQSLGSPHTQIVKVSEVENFVCVWGKFFNFPLAGSGRLAPWHK